MRHFSRAEIEAIAEATADAMATGRASLSLLDPLTAIIEALDTIDSDPDLEDGGDFEEGHDAERGGWCSGSTPDQYRLTYDVGADLKPRAFGRLPPGVPAFERVTGALPTAEIDRQRARLKELEVLPARAGRLHLSQI